MTEEKAKILLTYVKSILDIKGLSEKGQEWDYLYDENDDNSVVGFIEQSKESGIDQIDVNEIDDGFQFIYWTNDVHICEFSTSKSGLLREFIA